MYGLFRILGAGPQVSLSGRMFAVRGRVLRDYAEVEARIASLRGEPCDRVRYCCYLLDYDEAFAFRLVEKLRLGWWEASLGDSLEWLRSEEGRVFGLWLAIRREGVTLEWTQQATIQDCRGMTDEQREGWWLKIEQALDLANGDDELAAIEWAQESGGKSRQSGISWPTVFRVLAEEPYSFTPEAVADMTLSQIRTYYSDRDKICGREEEAPTTPEGLKRLAERANAPLWKAARNLVNGKHWNAT
jgi:hypothetical protein